MPKKPKNTTPIDIDAMMNSTDLDMDLGSVESLSVAADDLNFDEEEPTALNPDGTIRPIAETSKEEMQELQEERFARDAFHRSRVKERATMQDVADVDFFVNLIFQSKAQRDEFLQKVGWMRYLEDRQFMDGLRLAKALGVTITSPTPKPITRRVDKKYIALAEDGPLMKDHS